MSNKNTDAAFKALVDAIVPKTLELTEGKDSIQSLGAPDLHTDEFQIWSLNHYLSLHIAVLNCNINLANTTSKMLNAAARQLINANENMEEINTVPAEKDAFSALAPSDRFRSIALLEQHKANISSLPILFRINEGFIPAIISGITMFAVFSYYSEWSGYGSTRTKTPEKRKLEHFPIGWKQIGYPGPSKGYHALRGYL